MRKEEKRVDAQEPWGVLWASCTDPLRSTCDAWETGHQLYMSPYRDIEKCHGEEWAREPLRHTALQKEPSLQSCPAWSLLSLINLILPAVLAWALRPRIDHVAP